MWDISQLCGGATCARLRSFPTIIISCLPTPTPTRISPSFFYTYLALFNCCCLPVFVLYRSVAVSASCLPPARLSFTLGHFQAQWLTVDFAVPLLHLLSFSLLPCRSACDTHFGQFLYFLLFFCFCPRLVYIFTLEFAPCNFSSSFPATHTQWKWERERETGSVCVSERERHTLSGLCRLWTLCLLLLPNCFQRLPLCHINLL